MRIDNIKNGFENLKTLLIKWPLTTLLHRLFMPFFQEAFDGTLEHYQRTLGKFSDYFFSSLLFLEFGGGEPLWWKEPLTKLKPL